MTIRACGFCFHACFPARLLCHRCGGAEWTDIALDGGIVEEHTIIHHQADAATSGSVFLASVRTKPGVLVLARFTCELARGTRVSLDVTQTGAVQGRLAGEGQGGGA